jgi:hypothetical protein
MVAAAARGGRHAGASRVFSPPHRSRRMHLPESVFEA